jgi:valyl-tRNA synthetase
VAGEFAGMKIAEAREKIVEKLRAKGLLEKIDEKYVHNIATAERTGGVIEPQIKLQWFVAVNKKFTLANSKIKGIASGSQVTLKELMLAAVQNGDIAITPERFNAVYFHWINNLRDWCISRQIWYGHRIPVWYCAGCGKEKVRPEVKGRWFFVRHGETDWNAQKRYIGHAQESLNATGRQQAAATAAQLKTGKIDIIIASDLARTRETAEIIAEQIGFPKEKIIFDAALRERCYGEAEGVLHTEAEGRFGNLFHFDKKAPGGESYAEVEARAWAAVKKHKGDYHSKNVLIVTHAGTLRTVIKQIRNLTPEQMLARDSIKNGEVVAFDVHHECEKCGSDLFDQDPDTLDTWFSSGLWTFSTLGWPNETADLKRFHPTAVLETGYDIIFFWVARMILMSGFLLGEVPFKQVYLHGLVRDAKGQKMSKSLGNALDPLELADKYGADATRLSLIIGASAGNDQKLSEDKVRGYKNFANKIWNISRFVLMNFEGFTPEAAGEITNDADKLAVADFEKAKAECTAAIESFNFHAAGEGMYHYVWHTFADKVIEEAKPRLSDPATRASAQAMLWYILTGSLKALHPFMPFVTEEIWGKLPAWKGKTLLMVERW